MHHRGLCAALVVAAAACSSVSHPERMAGDPSPPPAPDESVDEQPKTFKGPAPELGPIVTQADPPPPLSGGTLLVTRDGTRAVAADPDRDRVYIVDLAEHAVRTVQLRPHDEPGRIAEDDAGRVHVVLRRGGAIATIELARGVLVARRSVCPTPRGIDWDTSRGRLLVACESGELVALGGALLGKPVVLAHVDRDLRDVVAVDDRVYVTRFRNAELLELDPAGRLAKRTRLLQKASTDDPALAWRMRPPPEGDADRRPVVVNQATSTNELSETDYYGGSVPPTPDSCNGNGIVRHLVTRDPEHPLALPEQAVLPIDFTFDGTTAAVVAAGNAHTPSLPKVFVVEAGYAGFGCVVTHLAATGEITSIARVPHAPARTWVVLSREPAQLEVFVAPERTATDDAVPTVITLAEDSRADTGHAIFHSNSGSGVACASCHAEGGDDGHVWRFPSAGSRKTPSLRGTLASTAPYHWDGSEPDIAHLVDDVMTQRMNGPAIEPDQKDALTSWLFALPAPIPPLFDAPAAARGRALFESGALGCATCHSGPKATDSRSYDVGYGSKFQVPSLVGVSARLPLMHDGCAKTLADRFGVCASPMHGNTAGLGAAQVEDLVAYLSSL